MRRSTWALSFFAWVALLFPLRGQEHYLTEQVNSPALGTARTIRIYLPASYHSDPQRRYPVLYLHDGQNVFSFAGTNIAFGWGSWELDKTADNLAKAGKIQQLILVAIDNSPARLAEYGGHHRRESTEPPTPYEKYDAFLRLELKPRIDARFRTRPGPTTTGLMGSSMGGLCSMVLAWEHPEVFGCAASLSGAFMMDQTNFLRAILRSATGPPKPLQLYLDSGVKDFMGGDDGRALTAQVAAEFRRIGWSEAVEGRPRSRPELWHFVDEHLLTPSELAVARLRPDKWAEAQTSQHNEFYWRLRVWRALTFLFPAG